MNLEFLARRKVAFAIFLACSILFLLPIFSNITSIGSYDWDQHLFYHGSAKVSIQKFGQFPFWNPFYCGGSPLLANPQSVFLSPFFLFVLLFGTVEGLKVEILVYLVIGLLGMFILARKMGIRVMASYLAAFVFMMSSWYASRIVVGHTTFFPFAMLPWVLFFYLKSMEAFYFGILSGFLMAIMFLSGGIYPFFFAGIIVGLFSVLDGIELQNAKPILLASLIMVFALLFAAVKLVPMLEFSSGAISEDTQISGAGYVFRGLFGYLQDGKENDLANGYYQQSDEIELGVPRIWGWHEYSAFIGFAAGLLVLVSFLDFKRSWKLIVLLVLFLVLSLGDYSPIPLYKIMKEIPLIGALHGPSRFMIMVAFMCSLLAARAVSDIKPLNKPNIQLIIILVVLLELFFVSRPLISKAFPIPSPQINTNEYTDYIHMLSLSKYESQYPNLLQNIDTVNCYERLHPRIKAKPQFFDTGDSYEFFVGNAFVFESNKTLNMTYFSPNKVRINAGGESKNHVVYNQNYYLGWHSTGALSPKDGLVAAVPDGAEYVEFTYVPNNFYKGLALTIISLIAAVLIFLKPNLARPNGCK